MRQTGTGIRSLLSKSVFLRAGVAGWWHLYSTGLKYIVTVPKLDYQRLEYTNGYCNTHGQEVASFEPSFTSMTFY